MTNRNFLAKERLFAQGLFRTLAVCHEEVELFLLDCEEVLFSLIQKSQKAEAYRAGIQDLAAKMDFFDMPRLLASQRPIDAHTFVTKDPRQLERDLAAFIRSATVRTYTASVFPAANSSSHSSCREEKDLKAEDLISTETSLTDDMAKELLSVGDEDMFQCGKCHQWTLRFTSQQRRSGDEMASEIRHCSTCRESSAH